MKRIATLAAFCLALISCSNNSKTAEMAEDVCGCFEPVTEDMSAKTKRILVKAFNNDDPQEVVRKEVQKIEDEDERTRVSEEIQGISSMGGNNKVKKCVTNLQKKYDVKESDKKTAREMVDKMEDVDDCEVAAAMMKMISRMQSDRTDEESTDNE